ESDLSVSSTLLTELKPHTHVKGGERSLAPLVARINRWREDDFQVLLVASSTVQAAHLQNLLLGHDLRLPLMTNPQWETLAASPTAGIALGHLSQGFSLPDDRFVFIAEEEIFGEKRHRRRSRPRPVADYLTGLSQLTTGDYVV